MQPLSMDLYDSITEAFKHTRTSNGRIDAIKLSEAAMLIAPLYDKIFGEGIVSNQLKDDIIGHATGLMDAVRDNPKYVYVDIMVPTMLTEKSIDDIRGKWGEGIIELLWTKRALDFISRFLDYGLLKHLDKSLYDCASMAYCEVLKPYHGFLVSSLVTLAFNLAPTRETFLESLGFSDIPAAQAKLYPFMRAVRPVLDHVHHVLDAHGCDFPDKV